MIMLFKKEKKMNVPDLWNFMTSLNKKDKALFEELLDNDNDCHNTCINIRCGLCIENI